MILKVINSGSKGNCYILEASNGENIIIEGGIRFAKITAAVNYDFTKTKFGLCTHEHLDHSKGISDLMSAGIDVVMSAGTASAKHLLGNDHRKILLKHGESYKSGDWSVMVFNTNHDCAEPLGFLIKHPESGITLFLTDTYFSEYTFPPCNNIMIEANFCEKIMIERFDQGYLQAFLRDRIFKSHLSLRHCKDILTANDITAVNNILLIHLSDTNSDSRRFQQEIEDLTFKTVNIAKPGLTLKWGRNPWE